MADAIAGSIERVTYHNPENGFAVLRVRVPNQEELVTVTGSLTSVMAGEYLNATGRWVINKEHGRQFEAKEIRTTQPTSAEGIERYLASGVLKGVGPKFAEKIVKLFGMKTLEVLENTPSFLADIHGIGPKRIQKIRVSWQEQRGVREIMLFLQQYGIGSGRAVRIYRTYGDQSVQVIRENPYRLAEDIRGIGFKTADDLAIKLGLPMDSPFRARAALRYMLQQFTTEGHCGYPEVGVIDKTMETLNIGEPVLRAAVEHELQVENLIRETVEGQTWLYLVPLHRAETGVAEEVFRLASANEHPLANINLDERIADLEAKLQIQLAPAQKDALQVACQNPFTVITGGPGVGKTTLVRGLLEIFQARGLRCVMTAPTGRAAKRMQETTGQTAKTIHRLLEFDPAKGGFKKDRAHPLKGDIFVLDECSMVDVVLAHQFLRAVPKGAVVILVGDVDQLPSVGPGMVLADMIAAGVIPVVRLTEIFRQASRSRIVMAAHAINAGDEPIFPPEEGLTDFYFVDAEEPDAIVDMLLKIVRERIPARFGVDPRLDVQVLAPMNRSVLGARNLNLVLQKALNPPAPRRAEIERYGWTFRVGDRVIQTENNYDREVFNGDMGVIEKIDDIEQEITVLFEGRPVTYDFGDTDELSLAYVLTIHKSQGSEYPCVVIPLHTQHFMMLQRNLLYTGVTRGKRLVVVIGSRRALNLAVRRQDTQQRFSALRHRLHTRFGLTTRYEDCLL